MSNNMFETPVEAFFSRWTIGPQVRLALNGDLGLPRVTKHLLDEPVAQFFFFFFQCPSRILSAWYLGSEAGCGHNLFAGCIRKSVYRIPSPRLIEKFSCIKYSKRNYLAILFFLENVHKYNFARKYEFHRRRPQCSLQNLSGWTVQYSILTVHFPPILDENKVASWSYCPLFPFTIFGLLYTQ